MFIKKENALKYWKLILVAALVMVLGSVCTVNVHAGTEGTWKKSGNLWWYQYDDKTYPASTWKKINGDWYYFDKNGWMCTGWQKIGGQWYYLGDSNSGRMYTGWLFYNGSWYYMDSSGAMQTGWEKIGAFWYFFNGSGAMLVDTVTPDGYYVNSYGQWQTVSCFTEMGKLLEETKDQLK